MPCRSALTTGSLFFPPSCNCTAPRRKSQLASRRLVSLLDAKCVIRLRSVPHSLSLLATFARTRTFFPRISLAYSVPREVILTQHKRAETRYNDHVVEKLYKPGVFVRVLQYVRNNGASSKLVPHYFGFCEVLEIRGPILIFESSHVASSRRITKPFASRHTLQTAFLLPRPLYRMQMIVRRLLHQTLVTERSRLCRL